MLNCCQSCLHSHHSLSLSTRDKFSGPSRFSAPGGSPRGATVPLPPVAGRLPSPQHQSLATGPTGERGHLAETVQKHAGHRPLHVRPNWLKQLEKKKVHYLLISVRVSYGFNIVFFFRILHFSKKKNVCQFSQDCLY